MTTEEKYCFDANVFITAWNVHYPKDIFPTLWDKLREKKDSIVVIKAVFYEIEYPEKLKEYLKQNFTPENLTEENNSFALSLRKKYNIEEELISKPKGVNSADLKLIAFAKGMGATLVTYESKQTDKPEKKSNYKIPLVCEEENISSITFVECLEKLHISV